MSLSHDLTAPTNQTGQAVVWAAVALAFVALDEMIKAETRKREPPAFIPPHFTQRPTIWQRLSRMFSRSRPVQAF